jgi:hypothetical protein
MGRSRDSEARDRNFCLVGSGCVPVDLVCIHLDSLLVLVRVRHKPVALSRLSCDALCRECAQKSELLEFVLSASELWMKHKNSIRRCSRLQAAQPHQASSFTCRSAGLHGGTSPHPELASRFSRDAKRNRDSPVRGYPRPGPGPRVPLRPQFPRSSSIATGVCAAFRSSNSLCTRMATSNLNPFCRTALNRSAPAAFCCKRTSRTKSSSVICTPRKPGSTASAPKPWPNSNACRPNANLATSRLTRIFLTGKHSRYSMPATCLRKSPLLWPQLPLHLKMGSFFQVTKKPTKTALAANLCQTRNEPANVSEPKIGTLITLFAANSGHFGIGFVSDAVARTPPSIPAAWPLQPQILADFVQHVHCGNAPFHCEGGEQ